MKDLQVAPVFANGRKSKEDYCFYKQWQKAKIAFSVCFAVSWYKGRVLPEPRELPRQAPSFGTTLALSMPSSHTLNCVSICALSQFTSCICQQDVVGYQKALTESWPVVWLSWLDGIPGTKMLPVKIPSQGTCLGCEFSPQLGARTEGSLSMSLTLMFLSLSSPLSKVKCLKNFF